MSRDRLKPLARVQHDATLATTGAQDQYFLIYSNGSRKKLSNQEAVLLYCKAADEKENGSFLVWKSANKGVTVIKKRRGRSQEQKFADEAAKWEEEARRLMLNLPPVNDD